MPPTISLSTTGAQRFGIEAQPPSASRRAASRLRIAFCLDNLGVGGTELNALRTAERLDRSRFDVCFTSLREDGPLATRIAAAGLELHPFPIRGLVGPSALRQGRRFAAFLRASRIDIVHSHDVYDNIFATAWARVAGVPRVMTSRRWLLPPRGRALNVVNMAANHLADRVLVNSEALKLLVCDREGMPRRRVVIIRNFADEAAFVPLSADAMSRERTTLGVPADAVIVGIIASLSPVKDHATLLRAMGELAGPRVRLVLVGEGECRDDLDRLARSMGIREFVHFAGLRPNDPNLHHLFDISVLCSISEGSPNSLVEAMAAGCPVVATRIGGVPDLVVDGVTGLLVPPRDSDALRAVISRLVATPAERARLGAAGVSRARVRHHASVVLPSLERVYEDLIPRRDTVGATR